MYIANNSKCNVLLKHIILTHVEDIIWLWIIFFQSTQFRPTLNLSLDTQTLTVYYSIEHIIMYDYCKKSYIIMIE